MSTLPQMTSSPLPIDVARKLPWNRLMELTEVEIQTAISQSKDADKNSQPIDAVEMIRRYMLVFRTFPPPNWLTGQVLDALAANESVR